MNVIRISMIAWLAVLVWTAPVRADGGGWDFAGNLGVELRYFPGQHRWPGQANGIEGSQYFNLEARWRSGRQRINIEPFGRLDSEDGERSHFDLREAYWALEGDDWQLLIGANRVFWGVTESRHLVDIVNQTDLVEDPDGEQKLGQPMVQFSLQHDWGAVDFFVMPYFRERTFPGAEGRLRPPFPADNDAASYESPAGQHHTDLALRWSHYFGDVDIGAYAFRGTGRNPKLLPAASGDRLVPYYHQITQWGLDLQYTRDAWLWKAEAIVRSGLEDTFFAAVAGFEYTFYGVGESDRDFGLLVEYLYDGRGPSEPVTSMENDVFIGGRLAFNDVQDTSLLGGVVVDLEEDEWFFSLEAERRLGEHYTIEGRMRFFRGDSPGGGLWAFDRDDYLQLSLARHF